jgi:hypothetical protein
MVNDKLRPTENDGTEQVKPEKVGHESQQGPASAAAQPDQSPAPGRRPLFRS